jgi:hypothetical protein
MKKQHVFLILILIINLISCSDENKSTLGSFQGIYFMGEGNFTRGNAKLDLYQYEKDSFKEDIFNAVNGYGIGDAAQSVYISNNNYFVIVVNNSNKLLWVDKTSLKVIRTLDLRQPRYISIIENNAALVSSNDGFLYIINIENATLIKTMTTNLFTDRIVKISSDKYFVEFQNKIGATNTEQGFLVYKNNNFDTFEKINTNFVPVGSIIFGNEIVSRYNDPKFTASSEIGKININSKDYQKIQVLKNPGYGVNASYNPIKNVFLFYDDNAIYEINSQFVTSKILTTENVISPYMISHLKNRNFYVISDALDYTKRSKSYIYDSKGTLLKSLETPIITNNAFEL